MVCLLPAALLLSWLLLVRVDFFYSVWYQVLDIDRHIAHYAPQNRRGKADFVRTTPMEHRRLFSQIVKAVDGREDLAVIDYYDENDRRLGQLLLPDEIGHLRDVARLVKVLLNWGWFFLGATTILALLLFRRRWALPPPKRVLLAALLLPPGIGLLVLLAGPQRVFDLLHEWVFPPPHPWFFYYQDSLMVTLFKAPQIFAAIAMSWAILALLFYGLIYAGVVRLARP